MLIPGNWGTKSGVRARGTGHRRAWCHGTGERGPGVTGPEREGLVSRDRRERAWCHGTGERGPGVTVSGTPANRPSAAVLPRPPEPGRGGGDRLRRHRVARACDRVGRSAAARGRRPAYRAAPGLTRRADPARPARDRVPSAAAPVTAL